MSAFGGKADVDQAPTLRPLLTQIGRIGFGHSWESQCASMGTPDGALSQSTDGAGVIREEEKSIDSKSAYGPFGPSCPFALIRRWP
jgi:hypothetical protein